MTDRLQDISLRLKAVQDRIAAACQAAGRSRDVDPVELVVVTKTFPASDVEHLITLGVADIAENRDQEARAKRVDVGPQASAVRWHMIGQIQRNKSNSVARWADVVESVDRPELAIALGRGAVTAGRSLEVLVQVGLDPVHRPERGGVAPAEAAALADVVAAQPGLRLAGVMGVAPYPGDPNSPGQEGAAFEVLRGVLDDISAAHPQATTMSAGMSDDLEIAIACGATQVRIGGAVLGHRDYVQ